MLHWHLEGGGAAAGMVVEAPVAAGSGPNVVEAGTGGARAPAAAASAVPALVLEGSLGGAAIRARLVAVPPESFFLRQHSFHWIQEYPRHR